MNKDLKVGDRVMLSEDTVWCTWEENNPTYTVGTVDGFDSEGWVGVDWGGIRNNYRPEDSDLIKQPSGEVGTKQIKKDALERLSYIKGVFDKLGCGSMYVSVSSLSNTDQYLKDNGYITVYMASHEYSVSITQKGYETLEGGVYISEYKQDKVYKTEFEVGDRVYLRAGSVARNPGMHPLWVIGTVVDETSYTSFRPVLWVKWGTIINAYKDEDLMSEEEYLDRSTELSIAPVGYTFESPKVAKEREAYANKIVIKYVTGEPYTIKNALVYRADWEDLSLGWFDSYGGMHEESLNDDVLCIEEWEENQLRAFFNPKYKKSAKLDVMTARQRCKKNNGDGGEYTPRLSGDSPIGIDIEGAAFGTSLRCQSLVEYLEPAFHQTQVVGTLRLPVTREELLGKYYEVTLKQGEELQELFITLGIHRGAESTLTDLPYLYVSNWGRFYSSSALINTSSTVSASEVDELLKRGA